MRAVASGRRPREDYAALLEATANDEVSPPVSGQGLCLEQVDYPPDLYLDPPTE